MKKTIKNITLLILILFLGKFNIYGQGFSHKGTEFIIPNIGVDSYQIITYQFPATVVIEDYGYGTTTTYNIPADTCYQLSTAYSPVPFSSIYGYVYTQTSNNVKKTVRVTSNIPISVQAQFGVYNTSSGAGSYPVIPKEYNRNTVTVYNKNRPDSLSKNDFFYIVATCFQDSTDVVIKPTHNTGHGWLKDSTYQIRMNKGDCFNFPGVGQMFTPFRDSTYNNNDFSGTTFTTLNPCHKISVMYLNGDNIKIPSTIGGITGDVLFEEFPPKEYLRTTSFVVPEKLSRLPDLLHVHATENNTQIFFDNIYVTTLQKNEQWDTLYDEPIKIQGSNPIFVSQYFLGRHFTTDTTDPEMMIAYPIQYRTSTFNFFLNRREIVNQVIRQLSIITDSFNVNTFTLNGVPVLASRFKPFAADSSMVYAAYRMPFPNSDQFFSLKSTGTFQAWVTNNQKFESEAYQSPLDSVLPIPPLPPPYFMDTCLYDTVPLQGKESAIGWLWNTNDTARAINIHSAGTYWVQNFYCADTIVDTFNITGYLYEYLKDSVCYGDSILFGGSFISKPGFYYDTTNYPLSCDTVFRLNLNHLHPTPTDTLLLDTICKGDSVEFGNIVYSQSGKFNDTLYYANGCDSLYITASIIVSADTTFIFDTICDNETISFDGNIIDSQGIYYKTETNTIGCDSLIIFNLTVNPTHYLRYDTSFCIKDSVLINNETIKKNGVNQFLFSNQFACDSLIEVNVTNYCPNIVFIPNSFTPNEDEHNDIFLPVFVNQDEIKNYSLLIFNRWGEIVFESTDLLIGWDGKQNGEFVPNNVFIWKLRYRANGETKELIGHLNVLR